MDSRLFMSKRKNAFTAIAIAACLACPFPVCSSLSQAHADEVSEAQAELDDVKALYDQAVQDYSDALVAFESARTELAGLRAVVASDKEKANASAKALYKSQRESLSTLNELFLSPDGFEGVLNYIDAMQRAYAYHSDVLAKSSAECKELELKEKEFSAKADLAQQRKEELDSALETALAAYETAKQEQEAREQEEAERQRQAEAEAAAAAESDDSSGSYESSYEYDDTVYEHNWVTGECESDVTVSVGELMFMGVVYANGYRYTYYNESVLPGPGLSIPGRHHEDGMICDGDGYICVASSDLPWGTVVPTPLGRPGKVYDCGCASGTIDLYLV